MPIRSPGLIGRTDELAAGLSAPWRRDSAG